MRGEIRVELVGGVKVFRYYLDGEEVRKEVYHDACAKRFVSRVAAGPPRWNKASHAAGVHKSQVGEAAARAAKLGVPTDYTPDGRPVFRDRAHRKKFLKAHRMIDHDGSYGD